MIKKRITILISLFIFLFTSAQEDKVAKSLSDTAIKGAAEKSCKCLDSIDANNKSKEARNLEISSCINNRVLVYMLSKSISESSKKIEDGRNKGKKVEISLNSNPDSEDYKQAYYDIETYMMNNCSRLRDLVTAAESHTDQMSKNEEALDFYEKAINASEKENWNEAIQNYKLALEKDPKFIYAWDNLGICYRRIGEYDNAHNAYQKSLEIDPKGKMPLQNIAITYVYKKEYQKAIDAYLAFDNIYPGDAEVYYGIGQVYFSYLKESEKALDYMCKAYIIYNKQKSAYRTDAETILSLIYKDMKEKGQLERFKEIMKNNKINFE
ncbi:tetratricopeptide repeat protein [Chryseobacterium daecheongense]|uniref:tetratricopeptide repeat protein n=1 Tax=Chryseobacterium daecheongense TaxID=192389 RepID=UPI001FD6606D|nr:tetratricopeptide repeat protein [Chryseobacterium daecheongense]UOU97902.1 tetratricopeptide repeat protein [Chryseobacterium daecheongense]